MNKQSVVTTVANESLDAMQCSREYMRWLSSLGSAIHADLTTGQGYIAKDLAGLVQYLVCCFRNNFSASLATLSLSFSTRGNASERPRDCP